MENLLNSLNIHHLGDNNYCSPLDSPELMSKINRYVDKVILESNTCIMLVISSSINFFYKKEINILFVSSVQWGLTYYNLPLERIQALKRYIRYKGYNFNLSQFGFFVNQRVNPKIKTINDIIKITGFNDLILEDDYFDISDSCMAV
tara:strand:- start:894 stop:1334 length:441 start_codon:yes stop_codon:yes gene_type:complete